MRVVGPLFLTDKEIDGMKALETPQWRGGITGGIWQSVQLVASGETYVDDVFIQPNIENNTALSSILIGYNQITNMDASNNLQLFELSITNNQLTNLNVKNGNNTFINRFDVVNNPNLTCIDVDDKAYSIANWKSIDPQAGFSETCGSLGVDEYLEQNITVYPNPTTTRVIINFDNQIDIKAIKTFDVYGRLLDTSIHNNIDLSRYSSGLYFLKMKTNKGNLTKKVIKL